jgi:hypothetical protein
VFDGDSLGSGDSSKYCDAFVPSGWVLNNDDLEPDCFSNDTDECGICAGDNSTCADCANVPNGNNVVDNCNTCDSDSSNDCVQDCALTWGGSAELTDYYFDSDGDGLGSGSAINICNAFVPTGWVANSTDEDDNCKTNIHDCAGVCDGEALNDSCGVCSGGTSGHAADSNQDCNGDCFGSAVVDNCEVCLPGDEVQENGSSDDCIQDCAFIWGGTAIYETYYVDIDGDGLGDSSGSAVTYCNDIAITGWVANSTDEDDNCKTQPSGTKASQISAALPLPRSSPSIST